MSRFKHINIADQSNIELHARLQENGSERKLSLIVYPLPCLVFGLYWFDLWSFSLTSRVPFFIQDFMNTIGFAVLCIIFGALFIRDWVRTGKEIQKIEKELAKRA